MKDTSVILLAAGASSRMGQPKLALPFGGRTALEHALLAFLQVEDSPVLEIILAVSPQTQDLAAGLANQYGALLPIRVCMGGATRGDSVFQALQLARGDVVCIHDGARCLVSWSVIQASIQAARAQGSGVAAIPCRDTLWQADGAATLPREGFCAAQTPQSFSRARLVAAYEDAQKAGVAATDDAAIYSRLYGPVTFSAGDLANQKLTVPEDIPLFATLLSPPAPRLGYGEDTHRLVAGRPLVLGGVTIPFHLGLLGHSDADALAHAAMDAMLGACALGDIGKLFPDTDPQYAGICSLTLLTQVLRRTLAQGYALSNLDATIVAQQPKLAPHIPAMRAKLAAAMACGQERISIKATTPEGCGPEGALESITVRCVCSMEAI
ncbi:MAG: 2-C-methyl-D-erythritol 2,4-cyclodiphosphate synthase [Oscillospiraceae bacterium]|nr:2-C-methyl-D-erythritol 2,4-cyclodiphosphate synthase [Christensenellales bacterium]HIR68141.1 2-C-methyl-D-erythritol 2,4-cyclodiphosphate synthase [Candidatus Pelethousia gallinarum]